MRVPKAYVVSILLTICTLLAAGYTQTANTRPAPETTDSQDANPKPSKSGGQTAPPNSLNSQATPLPGNAGGSGANRPGFGIPAVPANPSPVQSAPLGTAASGTQAPPSDYVVYLAFFLNMSALDKFADREERAGRHGSAAQWRTYDQKAAGLNDAEAGILKQVVADCNQALKAVDTKVQTAVQNFRAQPGVDIRTPLPPEILKMDDEPAAIINAHIQYLREALGEKSFQKLDRYVRSAFHPQVINLKPAPAPSPTSGRKDNQ